VSFLVLSEDPEPSKQKEPREFQMLISVFMASRRAGSGSPALDLADENASAAVMSSPPCSRGHGCIFSLNLNLV